jgi:hypothetical protein
MLIFRKNSNDREKDGLDWSHREFLTICDNIPFEKQSLTAMEKRTWILGE